MPGQLALAAQYLDKFFSSKTPGCPDHNSQLEWCHKRFSASGRPRLTVDADFCQDAVVSQVSWSTKLHADGSPFAANPGSVNLKAFPKTCKPKILFGSLIPHVAWGTNWLTLLLCRWSPARALAGWGLELEAMEAEVWTDAVYYYYFAVTVVCWDVVYSFP